jgi:hypothetical protein
LGIAANFVQVEPQHVLSRFDQLLLNLVALTFERRALSASWLAQKNETGRVR